MLYEHPADKQCNYSVDTSSFATKSELQEMKDELNEQIPVTDADGNPIYESTADYQDAAEHSSSFLYGSLLRPDSRDFYTYNVTFSRSVSSIKVIIEATGAINTGDNYSRLSFSLSTSSGIEIGSVGVTGTTKTLNANVNFNQFLSSVSIVATGTCSSSNSSESGNGVVRCSNLRIYLPEQLLS